MRKFLAATAIALTLLGAYQGTAHAAVIDTDTAVLQTTGGYAKVTFKWTSLSGAGTFSGLNDDTIASDKKCAYLYAKTYYRDGSASGWDLIDRTCSGGATPFTGTSSTRNIAKITLKLVVGDNSDVYSVSPGGA